MQYQKSVGRSLHANVMESKYLDQVCGVLV